MLSVARAFVRRDFGYSPIHRFFEITAILSFFALAALLLVRAYSGIELMGWNIAVWLIPLTAILGYLAADFASGFVHWMGDTYGSEATPLLGEAFVKPFREHHTDPLGIVRHDFVEVNGNNSILLVLFMVPVSLIAADPSAPIQFFVLVTSVFFTLGIFMTNQFHKWSHMDDPPAYICKLQDWRLVLGRSHHDIHHTAPFDTYYCITCGWLNPILQRLQFFETLERLLRRLFGVRTSREKSETI